MKLRLIIIFLLAGLCAPERCVAELILAVDVGVADPPPFPGSTPNDVQSGFQEFSAPHQFPLGDRDQYNVGISTLSRTINGIDIDIRAPDGNGGLYVDFASNVTGPLGNLAEDALIAPLSDILIDLDGLSAGTYAITTWHHVVVPASAVNGFDVNVLIGSSGPQTVANNVQWSSGSNPSGITSVDYAVQIGNGENLRIQLDSIGGSLTALSGFTVTSIPEPSSLVTATACLASMLLRRRRLGKGGS